MSDLSTDFNARRPVREYLRTSGVPYLSVLLCAAVLGQFAHYMLPTQALLKGQPAGVITHFLFMGASVVLWLLYRPAATWPRIFGAFLVAFALAWSAMVALSVWHGILFNHTVWLVLPAVLLVWLKPVDLPSVCRSVGVFAWSLVGISAVTMVLDGLGLKESRTWTGARWDALFDFSVYRGRWEGPFGEPDQGALLAVFLIIFGLCRRGIDRVAFVCWGLAALLLSGSRSGFLAALLGLGVLLIFSRKIWKLKLPTGLRLTVVLAGGVAAVALIFAVDSSGNGRTEIWSAFLGLWTRFPLLGAGQQGIIDLAAAGGIHPEIVEGHSVLLDPLARFGLVGFLPLFMAFVFAGVIVVRASIGGFIVGLAVFAAFLFMGMTNTLGDWRNLNVFTLPFLIAVMLSAASLQLIGRREGARPSDSDPPRC